MQAHRLATAVTLALALGAATPAAAQCQLDWLDGLPLAGVDGTVHAATSWDPDGAGPQPPRLVIGGEFSTVGAVAARNLATWTAQAGWQQLAGGVDGAVRSLHVLPNDQLAVAGAFTAAGGQPATRVARTDGATWTTYGLGLDDDVLALTTLPNGELVAGGRFLNTGSTPRRWLARYDGQAWQDVGAGVDDEVRALVTMPNGDLVAGGLFTGTGTGSTALRLTGRWDGTTWSAFGPMPNWVLSVDALLVRSTGELLAGGGMYSPSNGAFVLGSNGGPWQTVGAQLAFRVFDVLETTNGRLFACGDVNSVLNDGGLAELVGGQWLTRGEVDGTAPYALAELPNGDVVMGGRFDTAGGIGAKNLARWDGAGFARIDDGVDARVSAMLPLPDGDLVVAGSFRTIGGVEARRIARRDRDTGQFAPLGGGLDGYVAALTRLPNGDLVAGGWFGTAGGQPAQRVARWDGAAWHAMGQLGGAQVLALATLPNGVVVAAGTFPAGVVAWNGASWQPLGGGLAPTVHELLVLPNGDLVAAGNFSYVGGQWFGHLARWDGVTWSPIGLGTNGAVEALALTTAGDLIAGGSFTGASGQPATSLARWDGSSWSALGAHPLLAVTAVGALPNGDVLAADYGGRRLQKWDGAAWTLLDVFDGQAIDAFAYDGRHVYVGGAFTVGAPAQRWSSLARLDSSCPADVVPVGPGCAHANGQNRLTATAAWLGATVTETGAELPDPSFAVVVRGFASGSAAISSLLLQGQPGCTLWVAPLHLELLPTAAGTASTSWTVPPVAPLVGTDVYVQWAPFELDPTGALVAVTSTDALMLRVGAL